jgi:anaerobic selenocysteine-containing dehydrogenase
MTHTTHRTACTMDCPDCCALCVSQDSEGRVSIRGNPDHPFTQGFICNKGRDFHRRLSSPDRITHPMLRKGDHWQPISWDSALDLCAEAIGRYRSEPASILHFHGEGAKGVLKQAGKLFFGMLGATRVKGSLCDAAGYIAGVHDCGSRLNHDIEDILNSRRIVNWGKDLSRGSLHTTALVRRARQRGTRVLSISPGGDGNGDFSDALIRIRPGTDRHLAAGVIRLLLEEHRIPSFVHGHVYGWEAFQELILQKTPREWASASETTPEHLEQILSWYTSEGPTATFIGAGAQRYSHGGENVRYINALAMLSGQLGRSGGGSYFHMHSLRNLNLKWTKVPSGLPRRSLFMPTIGRGILDAVDPPIRMIWVNGSNVINQAPASMETARAFEQVELKVVVDAFMTDTAEGADLFLPSTLMLEQEDVVGSYLHDYVHHAAKVLEPPGEARSDHWILTEVGKRLDPPILLPEPDQCLRWSLNTDALPVSLEELREKKSVRAKRPIIAYSGMRFDHSDSRFHLPSRFHDEGAAPDGYPLRLLTLIRRDHLHSQIPPEQQTMPPTVWLAHDCPALEQLRLDEPVYLVSPLERMEVRIELSEGIHPRTVIYRRGDWWKLGGGANRLIQAGLTDLGDGAPYYDQHVRLENSRKAQEVE